MATEMRDYYKDGKKVGEFKVKNGLYLCYVPNKQLSIKHQTLENKQLMKLFFDRNRQH